MERVALEDSKFSILGFLCERVMRAGGFTFQTSGYPLPTHRFL